MRSLIVLLLLACCAMAPTAAQTNTVPLPDTLIWEAVPLPPFERGGDAIAFRGDTLYACISRVFRRPPGGDWEFAWRDLSCSKGWRWDPGVIYQARRGLERSTDGGQTWATVVEDRSVPPIDTPGGALLTSAEGGSARSTDNGITWTPALWPDGGGLPQSLLVVDPTPELPGGRIVGAGFNGVAYSDDDGRTWKPTEIYAFLGLYSENGVRITGGPEDGVLLVSLDGTPNGLSGGVWRSENGADWDLIGRTFDDVVAVNLTAGPDGQV